VINGRFVRGRMWPPQKDAAWSRAKQGKEKKKPREKHNARCISFGACPSIITIFPSHLILIR
jgi:hypothetical protein